MNTAMTFPVPSAVGSLESYIQAVNRFPVLTQEQEFDLATRFKTESDLDAARQLVLSHLRVVVSVARGYAGYGLPQADLIQEGNIGLMKAVKRYDPDRGVRLVSFALHWIRAEIHEFVVRNWRMVKIATTKAQRKLFFNLRSMKQGLEPLKPQQVSEIAQQLNVSERDVVEMEARFAGHDMALDPSGSDEDDSYAPIQYLADSDEHEPSRMLETAERERLQTSGLANALAGLDERSRRIVEARWLNEDESATLHELAAEFNVSAERIRQIEQKALGKMQAALLPAVI
ncbi:MAG: RNA polymerase sigma factor RpoH [Gallionella sp.]|nr:RNA polymerase sigma factor RpoH [Gallionella sp.]MCK9354572.1 RNA polymerase sigma factor RpoH [Gallionella sp.]